jgi:hypothetical protein
MLKNITIAKRKEVKTANQPTHDLVASDEKYENKVVVGAMWTRVTQDGTKFLSGGFSKNRTHEGKEYDGYVLVTENEYNEYQSLKSKKVDPSLGEVNVDEIPF